MKQAAGHAGVVHVLRLLPGDDVRDVLLAWAKDRSIQAAAIISAVGSLSQARIRYAGRADGTVTSRDMEICSLSGTLSEHELHLHVSIADPDGRMLGGHLLEGCVVRTTLELVVQEIDGVRMLRTKDDRTTYDELDPQTR